MSMFRYEVGIWVALIGSMLFSPIGLANSGFKHLTESQLNAFLENLWAHESALEKRIEKLTEQFLGVRFMASPLGEGPESDIDRDPLIRFDAVDCTTFVEQIMALSRSPNVQAAQKNLVQIRYQHGLVTYPSRNHFMLAQWIPNNQKSGFIEDSTVEIASSLVRWVTKQLDEKVWKQRTEKVAWPLLQPQQIPVGTFRLPVIPIKHMQSISSRIPSGTLINVVRKDISTMPVLISHQGIYVRKNGQGFLRHATRVGARRVTEEPLENFISRNLAYTKWPVEGFNLQRILPPERQASIQSSLFPDPQTKNNIQMEIFKEP